MIIRGLISTLAYALAASIALLFVVGLFLFLLGFA